MSGYGVIGAKSARATVRPARRTKRNEKVKLTFKQRIRNWLNDDDDSDSNLASNVVEGSTLQSDGMRFQLYKAAGGYVIETTQYDHKNDRRLNKIYVIGNDADLGAELGKIVTMEALRS